MKYAAKTLSFALILSTTMICARPSTSWSMLAPVPAAAGRAADMKSVQTTLESKVVQERLKALGLTDKEIDSRLAQLSDRQVHQLAKDIETLRAGGDLGGILVLVILVLLIVFLIHKI